MNHPSQRFVLGIASACAVCLSLSVFPSQLHADDPADTAAKESKAVAPVSATTPTAKPATPATTAKPKPAVKPKYPPHATVLKDFKTVSGLIPLYQKGTKLYGEISSSNFNKDFIVLISIARGISQGSLLGGMSWGFGDDWIWQFRKVDERIQIIRRNVRFKAKAGSPAAKAVKLAYTDSVLYALPIVTTGPKGGYIVDLSAVFMSDLPQISSQLPGFAFSPTKSSWAAVKGFKDNIELEVAATYASSGRANIDTVADSRGVTINVHYSISKLPSTGYKSRLADDRVGYFLTAVKDFSKNGKQDRFVRYINRWDLQKADPKAKLSPPKKSIVFWLEKTIPYKYRKPIREGILEWNKAFEKAGFVNAVEVRQQPDDNTWDPEDINYNTFRWITAGAGFAMGPSRVNPHTGQILDADIIFDADFLQYWKQEFETFTPGSVAAMTGGPLELADIRRHSQTDPFGQHGAFCRCRLSHGFSHEMAFGAAALMSRPNTPKEIEKMITQGLKEVTMHEVGHTLGLRHNFKASAMYTLADLNNPEKTKDTGLAASVMDYTPANLVPKDMKQGDYYSKTVGPYDLWAIEYGYKPVSGGSPKGELKELAKIAARSGEPNLAYLTDEDTRSIDSDPLSNRFDLGNDAVAYAHQRAKLIGELWPNLVERATKEGEGYQKARRVFNVLLAKYGSAMFIASRNVGGVYVSRSHRGDKGAKTPFEVVNANKQRAALKLVEDHVLSDKPFEFPPELYNHLTASRWYHWGSNLPNRTDYPIHEVILMWQSRILSQVMSSTVLQRLHDSELKVAADKDAFTTAELIERLTKAVFSETESLKKGQFTTRKPAITSLRRNLQRSYLRRLASLALGRTAAPDDCQTIAYAQLKGLKQRIDTLLANREVKLDAYSNAHLDETSARIGKILDAKLTLFSP